MWQVDVVVLSCHGGGASLLCEVIVSVRIHPVLVIEIGHVVLCCVIHCGRTGWCMVSSLCGWMSD